MFKQSWQRNALVIVYCYPYGDEGHKSFMSSRRNDGRRIEHWAQLLKEEDPKDRQTMVGTTLNQKDNLMLLKNNV